MCSNPINHKVKNIKSVYFYLIAIILGVLGGYFNINFLVTSGKFITDLFIKVFKCVSLPIISLSLIVTLSGFRESSHVRKMWGKTLYYTVLTTIIAAVVTCVLYYILAPANIDISHHQLSHEKVSIEGQHYLGYLNNIIPSNMFAPFIENQVMGVLLISLLVGLAIAFIPEETHRNAVSNFFKGAHGIFIVLTSWIVKIIPIGLFGFMITTIAQLKSGISISGLSQYLLVVVLANIVQGIVVLPALLYLHRIKPFAAMKGMLPALSVAFFSKSSAGTLPITIDSIEKNLQVSPKVSRFVLPLCTSINMNGCAAFIYATVIYVMQNQGMEINFATMMMWIVIATIAAIGNAGVPMGCFFLSASLLTSMNVPIELLGLILPFYSLIDMLETALNVWSDSCVAKIIHQKVVKDIPEANQQMT
jgi:Na+/H+-dicarboxylate symporter